MSIVLDAAVFLSLMVILVQISRPAPLRTRDLRVWSDDVERRLLADLPPRHRR